MSKCIFTCFVLKAGQQHVYLSLHKNQVIVMGANLREERKCQRCEAEWWLGKGNTVVPFVLLSWPGVQIMKQ